MQKYIAPAEKDWPLLTRRPAPPQQNLNALVSEIFLAVEKQGDVAVATYNRLFDKQDGPVKQVSPETIQLAAKQVSGDLRDAIGLARRNIECFHKAQVETPQKIITTKGVTCWRESRAIERVGLYIPGGSAPLFSTVLMLGVPAKIAGCKHITLCTPPDEQGTINPIILYTASLLGISNIVPIGGIQAIAAMSIGTETIPKADKILGPGNQYVTAAKQMAQQRGTAIDMPAGPSEVLIIADESCNPDFVAADLLSQAEHGADSQVILLSDKEWVLDACLRALQQQLERLPRKEIATSALAGSKAILLNDIATCIAFSNCYAPEHLILAIENPVLWSADVSHAGSVFLGNYSCESAGDYASGTNHTLPTNGFARNYSGVSLDSFIRKITFQELTPEGIQNIGPAIEHMAEAEQLWGHKNAVTLRLKSLTHV